jgi:hypothetical protein
MTERLRESRAKIKAAGPSGYYELVILPLTKPPKLGSFNEPERRRIWETTCDRCGLDCLGKPFNTASIEIKDQEQRIRFTFGLCADCYRKETAE